MTCPRCQARNEPGASACVSCGARLGPSGSLEPGAELSGRYRIVRRLGSGGMGDVFEAYDQRLEMRVALKVLRGPSLQKDARSRFRREIKLARAVRHRNVCAIHDLGEDGDFEFFSMELVEGQDLRHIIQEKGPLNWEPACDVVLQIAEGLSEETAVVMAARAAPPVGTEVQTNIAKF